MRECRLLFFHTIRHVAVPCLLAMVLNLCVLTGSSHADGSQKHYYAHDVVLDKNGVIAPWYRQQNGQIDLRIRIAAQTLKRYPWIGADRCPLRVPEYLLSSFWTITPGGDITTKPLTELMNGDRGKLAAYVLMLMPEYYRYSGDPMAIAHATMEADAFLQLAQTDEHHPWPRFPISVPVKGKVYGPCDPKGIIQLDLAARVGYGLLRVFQLTGERRYFEAVQHWGDVLAEKARLTPGAALWDRYANFEDIDAQWKDNKQTGSVVAILAMLDELIRLGYTGTNDSIVKARDAGRAYVTGTLLPAWSVNDTWGRQYWDWACPVQVPNVTAWAALYMMDHKDAFPNWKIDCRNMMALCLNRTCVSPASMGGVYSGAWAYPESCICCRSCLLAGPQLLSEAWARYGAEADSWWAREIARRQMILATYDCLETGRAVDGIHGGMVTNEDWFEAAQLSPMETALKVIRWLPETFAPPRENHIVRSSSVVNRVVYGKGLIAYATFDAPANCIDVLRLAFVPTVVKADGKPLEQSEDMRENSYTIGKLADGDCIVSLRHDGKTQVSIEGNDPSSVIDDGKLTWAGEWAERRSENDFGGGVHFSAKPGSTVHLRFTGNQIHVLGRAGPQGGMAGVFIDDAKDPAGIDCWCPQSRSQQTIFARNGLSNGEHEIRLEVSGKGNPRSEGAEVNVDAMIWSAATAEPSFGEGNGPTEAQRMIFGYTRRQDFQDSAGHAWRPGCEFVVRSGNRVDSVEAAWWTQPAKAAIANTTDPDLYRYGIHAPEFRVNTTVGPGAYRVRLRFAAAAERHLDTKTHPMDVFINDQRVAERLDVVAAAGGEDRAADLVFKKIVPLHGIIDIRFVAIGTRVEWKTAKGEAFIQAIEIMPDKE